jgi:hypothetical protein
MSPLVTLRRGYSHHGIYVGDGKVVHYAGLCSAWHRGPVEEVLLEHFAQVARCQSSRLPAPGIPPRKWLKGRAHGWVRTIIGSHAMTANTSVNGVFAVKAVVSNSGSSGHMCGTVQTADNFPSTLYCRFSSGIPVNRIRSRS